MRWFYHIARITVRISLFLFTSCQLKGVKSIPKKGPLLIIANHLSMADPPLVSVSINRETVFMAKEELFRTGFSNYFIRSFGAFPVRRNRLDRTALNEAERVLSSGKVLVMFPEATRSKNGGLQKAFPGAAMIALRNGAPIVPIAITGTEKIRGLSWIFHRYRLKLTVGQPFHLPSGNGKVFRQQITECADLMMEHIAEILPESYRGEYGKKESPDGDRS